MIKIFDYSQLNTSAEITSRLRAALIEIEIAMNIPQKTLWYICNLKAKKFSIPEKLVSQEEFFDEFKKSFGIDIRMIAMYLESPAVKQAIEIDRYALSAKYGIVYFPVL